MSKFQNRMSKQKSIVITLPTSVNKITRHFIRLLKTLHFDRDIKHCMYKYMGNGFCIPIRWIWPNRRV